MSVVSGRSQVRSARETQQVITSLVGDIKRSSSVRQRYNERVAAFNKITRELQDGKPKFPVTPKRRGKTPDPKTPRNWTSNNTPIRRPSSTFANDAFYNKQITWMKRREHIIDVERTRRTRDSENEERELRRLGVKPKGAWKEPILQHRGFPQQRAQTEIEKIMENLNRIRKILE